jgi:hypothetical protein
MCLRAVYLASLCLAIGGCAIPSSARYVYQDGEFGVIGIPQNSFQGKIDYQAQAERLMSRHFPAGYEIVRAEEVVEGEKLLDLGKKTDIVAQLAALNQMMALGRLNRATSFQEKDKLQIRECRIIYRKKSGGAPSGANHRFAEVASLTPPLYLDPNEALRHPAGTATLAKVGPVSHRTSDPDAERVSRPSLK